MPIQIENKKFCNHTQYTQTFLVKPTRGVEYIHGKDTKMIDCINNSTYPLMSDSGAHFSILAREYLDNHLPNREKKLFPTKAKNFKHASGKMISIGTIIKEIIIPHKKR
ncbi:hypothetical protein O181_036353 [Austropuccinia psidii MF-1]|uniref:Uncharacterized protein n=1 Tax=Austropuccinia psidii MF-1 TaxID=1389203 RepID=A0A9Q3D7A2_9BASI|nr:hypothetical protein [Austropuccinia psidii MF-1]